MINLQELIEKLRPEMVGISRRARFQDGWLEVEETASYASASSITMTVDVRVMIVAGTRIRIMQSGGTWKYFVVVSTSLDVDDTITINVTGGSDYTVANEAISRVQISYMSGAQPGWPGWFNWTAVFTGFSADPTNVISRFNPVGRMIYFWHKENTNGTSNATGFTISLPVAAYDHPTIGGGQWAGQCGYAVDNSAGINNARWIILDAGTVIDLYPSSTSTTWTASGGKRAYLEGFYEF